MNMGKARGLDHRVADDTPDRALRHFYEYEFAQRGEHGRGQPQQTVTDQKTADMLHCGQPQKNRAQVRCARKSLPKEEGRKPKAITSSLHL